MNITERYIELLKKSLINEIYIENEVKLFYIIQCLIEKQPVSNEFLVNPEKLSGLVRAIKDVKNMGATLDLQSRIVKDKSSLCTICEMFSSFPIQ